MAYSWGNSVISPFSFEFDSNPALSPNNPVAVWRGLIEPNYTLRGSDGRDELKTTLGLQLSRSTNEDVSPKRSNPSATIEWLRQHELGELGISSKYAEVAVRDVKLDALTPPPVGSTRVSRNITGKLSKSFSELSTILLEGAYEGVSYTGGGLVDYSTRTENMTYNYTWSEDNKPFLQLTHVDYMPEGGTAPSSFTNTILIGSRWRFSDKVSGDFQVGKSKVSVLDVSNQAGMSVQYTGERAQFSLKLNRQVSPSGQGGFITVAQYNASSSYAWSENSNFGLDVGWQKNQSTFESNNSSSNLWIQRSLSHAWGIKAYYRNIVASGELIETAFANIVGITLDYTNIDF